MVKDADGKEIESYTIKADIILALFQYLGSKPYIEVSTLVSQIDSAAIPNYTKVEDNS